MRRALVVAVVLGLVAAGCGDDGDGGPSTSDAGRDRDVTVVLNWSPNTHHIGLYVARHEGWFDDAGLDVTIIEPGEGGAEQAVGTGTAEFGLSIAEGVLPARAQGVPIVSIATVLPTNDSSLMTLSSAGVTRPADLAGKVYGGYGGPLETEIIRALVRCDGGDPDAVRQVEVGDAEYLPAMEQGRFDAVWVFDGWDVARARVDDVAVSTIDFRDWETCIPNWYTPVYIASEATVGDDPELVRTFLEVVARGYALAEEDPVAAAEAFEAEVPELDPDLVEASTTYYAPLWREGGARWGEQDPAVWSRFDEFLRDAGGLEGDGDPADAFTNDLLPTSS